MVREGGTQYGHGDVPPQIRKGSQFPRFRIDPRSGYFLVQGLEGMIVGPLQAVKNRLSEFALRYVDDPGASPSHSWRHRFRTVATEADIECNVIDAICGWSAKSVGNRDGSISLKARSDPILCLPWITL